MEYSTVQKIVQIIDNDTDLAATKLVIKDLKTKPNGEKRFDSGSEAKSEIPTNDSTSVLQTQFDRISQNK